MKKDNSRNDAELRVSLIRERYRILSNENSRDYVTYGLLADIGVLLKEVDYWRAEYTQLQSLHDNHRVENNNHTAVNDSFLNEENVSFECPQCKASLGDNNHDGISWDSVGRMINSDGFSFDIGYIHCSDCGKDSPLYAGKETAFLNWCIEVV